MLSLVVDTSTEYTLLAIFHQRKLLWQSPLIFENQQAHSLLPKLAEALKNLGLEIGNFTCIIVGTGPGSYTGLRVGAAAVQGLSYSCQIPLIGVCSLYAFAPLEKDIPHITLINARMNSIYVLSKRGQREKEEGKLLPYHCTIKEFFSSLPDKTVHLVSPHVEHLSPLFQTFTPLPLNWEQALPSAEALFNTGIESYFDRTSFNQSALQLSYLRPLYAQPLKTHS